MSVSSQPRSSWRELRFVSMAVVSVIVSLLMPSLSASAARVSVVTDPVGDALFSAPSYLDLVGARVTKSGQTFSFEMTVAEPIPATPSASPPASAQTGWAWPLDTDSSTFPAGTPVAPGTGAPAELIVAVVWDSSGFSASLNDRRPLLTGGDAVLTPLPFTISGGQLRVDIRASAIGDPSTFGWRPVTFYWSAPFGSNNGNHFVDSVPDYVPFP